MRAMGIRAIYSKPKTSIKNHEHQVCQYLLNDLAITRPNQVWQVDITYIRTKCGFVYLTALIDVYSRYIVGWSLSNNMDTLFCLGALDKDLIHGTPEIINSDQGAQFASNKWTDSLREKVITISMTGKGRCLDNVYI